MLLRELSEQYWGVRAAGLIVVSKDNRILLGKRSQHVNEPNTWSYPGGKLDTGEMNPKNVAKREFIEETGYEGDFKNIRLLDVFEDGKFKYYTFIAEVNREFKAIPDWENSKFKWFNIDELPKPLHFGCKRILHKLKKALNETI